MTFSINEAFISKYDKNTYEIKLVEKLFLLNISEPYIAHYNYGNVLYKNNEFQQAIEEYQKALSLFPTKYKECKIRINLALAMLTEVDEKNKTNDQNIEILKDAREVLCEDGCANRDNNNGHSKDAEKLKADIDKLIKKLQEKQDDKKQDNKNDNKEEEQDNKSKEQQLQEIQNQAMQERQERLEMYQVMKDYEYYGGKSW